MPERKIIIICGPTAVGKTVVIQQVLQRLPSLRTGITFTTRPAREMATEDKVMHYITREEFENKIASNVFVEWAEYNHNYYGTSKDSLAADNNPILLNLDIRGSLQMREKYPNSLLLFIAPENIEQIRERLERRNLSPEALQDRLQVAQECLAGASHFDHIIINKQGKLDQTVAEIVKHITSYLMLDKEPKNS